MSNKDINAAQLFTQPSADSALGAFLPCASGGTLSNFPMSLFANKRVELKIEGKPVCSTLGVRFGQDRSKLPTVDNAGHYLSSVFDTSRNLADREFLFMNEQHKKWVGVSVQRTA
jgi:hypothetical protein